jgi:PAS domain S-box-containing protein
LPSGCASCPDTPRFDAGLAAAAFDALPVAVYTVDRDGWITSFNTAAEKLWGRRPGVHQIRWCGSAQLYRPDGAPLPIDEAPIVLAVREGREISNAEVVAERTDGIRVPLIAHPSPLRNEAGEVVGGVNLLLDQTDRHRAALKELHLASIVESSHDAIISKDLNSIIATWNAGAEELFGYTAAEAVGQHINLLIPEDRRDEEPRIIERIRRGEKVDHFETQRRRKDGSLVDISLTISPVRDERGRIVGASKIARDVSDRRRAEEQQRLILREMSHRIKNLFSVAASIVTISARTAATPDEMARSVRARLDALTRAQALTRPGLLDVDRNINETTLVQLLATILEPFGGSEDHGQGVAFRLSGQEVLLGGTAITSLSLVFHEFATNAAKYGALSVPGGRVEVEWHLAEGRLVLTWRETGGPALTGPPSHIGFGGTLSQRLIAGQFGGSLDYRWAPEGLSVQVNLDLERLGWKGPG